MTKLFNLDLCFSKLIYEALFIAVLSSAAFGATFTVTKAADTNDNVCDADCSLREAIAAANSTTEADTIVFSSLFNSPQTIVLSVGELVISNASIALTIEGTGANLLAISGNNASRVFMVNAGTEATINNLTVTQGNFSNSFEGGGGIYNRGTLNVNNSIVTGNKTSSIGGGFRNNGTLNIINSVISNNIAIDNININTRGGAVYNDGATVNIINSTISGNSSYSSGGGIESELNGGVVTVTNSIISGNTAVNGFGGGIRNNAALTILHSTISNNSARGDGGGFFNFGGASIVTVTNSTISGNSAGDDGGGFASRFGTVNLNHLTIANNTSDIVGTGAGIGGGIHNDEAVINSRNTIIADNVSRSGIASDIFGGLNSQGYNLIENTDSTTISGITTGNILGQDPQLAPLRSNGGATQTVALLPTSPAIDAADPNNFSATDQRGVPRPQDGDLNGSFVSDIGAYERQVSAVFVVTKTADTNDANCDADCSLREAVSQLNLSSAPDKSVIFDANLFTTPQTITLTLGQLQITNTNGTSFIKGTDTSLLTLSGNNTSRIFSVNADVAAAIAGLTIVQGNPFDGSEGGGILNRGSLAINNVLLRNNRAENGSAIRNLGGRLNVINSTVTNNQFDGFSGSGGGIYSDGGNVNIANSIINNNSTGSGGGILNYFASTMTINNTSVNNNSAPGFGGGGIKNLGILNINNSTVSNNTSSGSGAIDHTFGTLTITNSSINDNTGSEGGGISHFNGGTIIITNSSISNNKALAPGFGTGGGGILIGSGGNVTVNNSTISGNLTTAQGGGVAVFLGTFNAINSTISSNSAIDNGQSSVSSGGIENYRGTVNLINATVAFNFASSNAGGIRKIDNNGTVNVRNTIISNNTAGSAATSADFSGMLNSQGYNLLGDTTGAIITGNTTGNLLNINPQLDPVLRRNGGLTYTHALRSGSPAIDKGSVVSGVATDQRGVARPFDFPAITNAPGGNGSDIGSFERRSIDVDRLTLFDFDGDGKADVSVFRPENGTWYLNQSQNGFAGVTFGASTDKIVPADYDGDGKTDVAVFRGGTWYLQRSSLGFTGVTFGAADDIPIPADYDGDGKADIAVFRPSNGTWYLLQSQLGFTGVVFGQAGDIPVAADYDGDGRADIAVNRSGTWYLQRSQLGFTGIQFGEATDKLVPADYDGDGRADVAVFRPSNGTWYLLQSTTGFTGISFGISTDLPVPADYDGDGKSDVAVYRSGTWYLNRSMAGLTGISFGAAADKPIPHAFVQ